MEIEVMAYPVKYHSLEEGNGFITLTQNRTRRRVYDGYHFLDTGRHIYVAEQVAGMFQHKRKGRNFIVDSETKEWRDTLEVVRHVPELRTEEVEPIQELER